MNQKLLQMAIAFASVCATPAMAGDASISFYGKANISLNANDFETVAGGGVTQDADNWTLNSNASRLGVKGSLPLRENLKAIYKAEYEIFIDGDGDEFSQRNIYGGLLGEWGTVIAGKHDTPLKLAQGKVDRFNDLDRGDIKFLLVGENRQNDIIMYTTPKLNGFSFTAAIMPGEESGNSANDNDGLVDHISLALTYRNDMFYFAAAADDDVKDTDIIRLVGEFYCNESSLGTFKVGGLFQTAEQNSSGDTIGSIKDPIGDISGDYKEQDAYLLSGEWRLAKSDSAPAVGNIVLKAQFGYSESTPDTSGLDETETTQVTFGADYKLSKAAKLFVYYSQIEAEGDSALADADVTDSTLGIGTEIKF